MKLQKALHESALGHRHIAGHFCDAPNVFRAFNAGNTTSVEENKNRLVDFAEFVMRTPSPPEEAEEDEEFKESLVDRIENLSEIKSKDYTRYVYFCENVVSPF